MTKTKGDNSKTILELRTNMVENTKQNKIKNDVLYKSRKSNLKNRWIYLELCLRLIVVENNKENHT